MLPTVMALSFVDKLGELLVCSSSTRVPLQGLRSGWRGLRPLNLSG